jgi:hypothetical protein
VLFRFGELNPQTRFPQADLVTAFERVRRDALLPVVYEGAVDAPEIGKNKAIFFLSNLTVFSPQRGVVQHQVAHAAAPDNDRVTAEGKNLSGVGAGENSEGDHRDTLSVVENSENVKK